MFGITFLNLKSQTVKNQYGIFIGFTYIVNRSQCVISFFVVNYLYFINCYLFSLLYLRVEQISHDSRKNSFIT